MQIVDVIIVLMILLGAVSGFKDGVLKKTTSFVGLILVVVLSFILKNPLSVILYNNLPFFSFAGKLKNLTVLNVLLYEILSFLIVFAVLMLVLRILLIITGIIEKVFKATVILAIPSKLLGLVVGALQGYVVVFIVLYVLTLPIFNIDIVQDSKYKDQILNNSPGLSNLCNQSVNNYFEVEEVITKYDGNDSDKGNADILDVLLKNKIITTENASSLVDKGRIPSSCAPVINKYK